MSKLRTRKRKGSHAELKMNRLLSKVIKVLEPPESIRVDEWADKYRILSSESSAEAGLWRTSRTPYLRDIMGAFTDPKVNHIVMVAASQVGKSEAILNMIAYIIDQDPGSILFIQPTLDDAKKFSRLRIAPMIRDCKRLRDKVSDVKTRDSGNTILQKQFPGGMLTMAGSNSPSALASTPVRYVFGDERDRWGSSAGTEGDPWKLTEARQATFYNRKSVEVSTPTIAGSSVIAQAFERGTKERWCTQCPECGEYSEIRFDHIHFDYDKRELDGKVQYELKSGIEWACPKCGCLIPEDKARRQSMKWVADAPGAYADGYRSFWLTAFASPWTPWSKIVKEFLKAKGNPRELQVVFNTLFGELWEERGDTPDDDEIFKRREDYGKMPDGSDVEVPNAVYVITAGFDTQDNRMEYELVGHGLAGETWGIKKGIIMGKPDEDATWERIDEILNHDYIRQDGKALRIGMSFIDSGGHFTQEVYKRCRDRKNRKVFAIKGKGGESIPYIAPPSKVPVNGNRKMTAYLYTIGVDAGKAAIMDNLKIREVGAKYCHFPQGLSYGYDKNYFRGLLSETLELVETKSGKKWQWKKLPGHNRNEALDCRNYAMAAFQVMNVDMIRECAKVIGQEERKEKMQQRVSRQHTNPNVERYFEGW